MARWLSALAVALVVTLGAATGRAEFNPPGLSGDSDAYVNALTAKSPPQPNPAARDTALAEGRAALAAKDGAKAVAALEKAITLGAAEPAVLRVAAHDRTASGLLLPLLRARRAMARMAERLRDLSLRRFVLLAFGTLAALLALLAWLERFG